MVVDEEKIITLSFSLDFLKKNYYSARQDY